MNEREQQPKRNEDLQKEPESKQVYMEETHKTDQRHSMIAYYNIYIRNKASRLQNKS